MKGDRNELDALLAHDLFEPGTPRRMTPRDETTPTVATTQDRYDSDQPMPQRTGRMSSGPSF